MKFDKEGIIKAFGLEQSGGKGWWDGKCVFCGKDHHMGVIFASSGRKKSPSFKCFKCGEKGSLYRMLKHAGRMDLVSGSQSLPGVNDKKISKSSLLDLDTTPKECVLPKSYSRISYHEYLDKRGFTKEQYDIFGVATAVDDVRYKDDYILFTVYDDNKICGVLGRSLWSDKDRDKHNKKVKDEGYGSRHPKYKNLSADFSKMLVGYDEISEETHTVIVVEGVTDKASVDRNLVLYGTPWIKCCCTFGKDISPEQMCKLYKKGVKNIILFYDPDAIESIKSSLNEMFTYFDSVSAMISKSSNDAGDMEAAEMIDCLNDRVDVVSMNFRVINKNKLLKWKR